MSYIIIIIILYINEASECRVIIVMLDNNIIVRAAIA